MQIKRCISYSNQENGNDFLDCLAHLHQWKAQRTCGVKVDATSCTWLLAKVQTPLVHNKDTTDSNNINNKR
jgi:hypothetical protein